MTSLLSPEITRWVLAEAARDEHNCFDWSPPHYCHICGEPVALKDQLRHVGTHRRAARREADAQKAAATKRLRAMSRLRHEGRKA